MTEEEAALTEAEVVLTEAAEAGSTGAAAGAEGEGVSTGAPGAAGLRTRVTSGPAEVTEEGEGAAADAADPPAAAERGVSGAGSGLGRGAARRGEEE